MAYATNDADDWFRAGYMPLARLTNDQAFREEYLQPVVERLLRRLQVAETDRADWRTRLHGIADRFFTEPGGPCQLFRGDHDPNVFDPTSPEADKAFKYLRAWAFDLFISGISIGHRESVPEGTPRRYRLVLDKSERAMVWSEVLKSLLWRFVVREHRMATLQHGQKRVVAELFEAHVAAVLAGDLSLLPNTYRSRLSTTENPDERLRVVVDYVSGMTDDYAMARHARLLRGEGRFHELPT